MVRRHLALLVILIGRARADVAIEEPAQLAMHAGVMVDLDGDGVPDSIRISMGKLWINDVAVLSNLENQEPEPARFEVVDFDPSDGRKEVMVLVPGSENEGVLWVIGYRDRRAKVLLRAFADPLASHYVPRNGTIAIQEYVYPGAREWGCRRMRSDYRWIGGVIKRVGRTVGKPTECAG